MNKAVNFSSLYIGLLVSLSMFGCLRTSEDLRKESCGDGEKQEWEECDDGNPIDTDSCHNNCTVNDCNSSDYDCDTLDNDCDGKVDEQNERDLINEHSNSCSEETLTNETMNIAIEGGNAAPMNPENDDAVCSDGIDNDEDSYTDCDDNSCSRNNTVIVCDRDTGGSESISNTEQMGTESSDTECADGVDNDGDGYADCDDLDCSRNSAVTVCGEQSEEGTDAACSDGMDNDRDGYADCDDYDCSRNPAVTVCGE